MRAPQLIGDALGAVQHRGSHLQIDADVRLVGTATGTFAILTF